MSSGCLEKPGYSKGKFNLVLRLVFVLPIKAYRFFISPLKGRSCRFWPTCSHYAEEAIMRHGIIKGGTLATWRVLRCGPWHPGGHDPVP